MEQQKSRYTQFVENVIGWSTKTNIIGSGFVDGQYIKFAEEGGELAGMIARKNVPEIKDATGDLQVILINLVSMFGADAAYCFEAAQTHIKTNGTDAIKETNIAKLLGKLNTIMAYIAIGIEEDGTAKSGFKPLFFEEFVSDILLILTEIARRYDFTPEEALASAWDVIKDREGIFYNRVFIKSADFTRPMLEDMLAGGELPQASVDMANRYLAKLD